MLRNDSLSRIPQILNEQIQLQQQQSSFKFATPQLGKHPNQNPDSDSDYQQLSNEAQNQISDPLSEKSMQQRSLAQQLFDLVNMDIDDPLLFEQNIKELKQKHLQSHLKQYESMRLGGQYIPHGKNGSHSVNKSGGSGSNYGGQILDKQAQLIMQQQFQNATPIINGKRKMKSRQLNGVPHQTMTQASNGGGLMQQPQVQTSNLISTNSSINGVGLFKNQQSQHGALINQLNSNSTSSDGFMLASFSKAPNNGNNVSSSNPYPQNLESNSKNSTLNQLNQKNSSDHMPQVGARVRLKQMHLQNNNVISGANFFNQAQQPQSLDPIQGTKSLSQKSNAANYYYGTNGSNQRPLDPLSNTGGSNGLGGCSLQQLDALSGKSLAQGSIGNTQGGSNEVFQLPRIENGNIQSTNQQTDTLDSNGKEDKIKSLLHSSLNQKVNTLQLGQNFKQTSNTLKKSSHPKYQPQQKQPQQNFFQYLPPTQLQSATIHDTSDVAQTPVQLHKHATSNYNHQQQLQHPASLVQSTTTTLPSPFSQLQSVTSSQQPINGGGLLKQDSFQNYHQIQHQNQQQHQHSIIATKSQKRKTFQLKDYGIDVNLATATLNGQVNTNINLNVNAWAPTHPQNQLNSSGHHSNNLAPAIDKEARRTFNEFTEGLIGTGTAHANVGQSYHSQMITLQGNNKSKNGQTASGMKQPQHITRGNTVVSGAIDQGHHHNASFGPPGQNMQEMKMSVNLVQNQSNDAATKYKTQNQDGLGASTHHQQYYQLTQLSNSNPQSLHSSPIKYHKQQKREVIQNQAFNSSTSSQPTSHQYSDSSYLPLNRSNNGLTQTNSNSHQSQNSQNLNFGASRIQLIKQQQLKNQYFQLQQQQLEQISVNGIGSGERVSSTDASQKSHGSLNGKLSLNQRQKEAVYQTANQGNQGQKDSSSTQQQPPQLSQHQQQQQLKQLIQLSNKQSKQLSEAFNAHKIQTDYLRQQQQMGLKHQDSQHQLNPQREKKH